MAIDILKDSRSTIKQLVLEACLGALLDSGYTVDDSNFFITKITKEAMVNRYRDTMYTMPFLEQRAKLKCCRRICRFVMWIDLFLQSNLRNVVRNQISRFEADVRRHFQYIPNDDLLTNTDVEAVLEAERSAEDPKVSVCLNYNH